MLRQTLSPCSPPLRRRGLLSPELSPLSPLVPQASPETPRSPAESTAESTTIPGDGPGRFDSYSGLQEVIFRIHQEQRSENTKKQYSGMAKEWFAFCDYQNAKEEAPHRYLVTCEKTYRFITYQAFRGKRKQGGKRVS